MAILPILQKCENCMVTFSPHSRGRFRFKNRFFEILFLLSFRIVKIFQTENGTDYSVSLKNSV